MFTERTGHEIDRAVLDASANVFRRHMGHFRADWSGDVVRRYHGHRPPEKCLRRGHVLSSRAIKQTQSPVNRTQRAILTIERLAKQYM